LAFDIRTLAVISGVACLVFVFAMLALVRLHRGEPGLWDWVRGAVLGVVGNALLGLRGAAPDLLTIVAANSLLLMGAAYLYLGTCGLLGRKVPRWWPWALSLAAVGPQCWFTYITPSVPARIVVVSLLFIPSMVGAAWAFWRYDQALGPNSLRPANRLTMLLFLSGALLFGARAVAASSNLTDAKYAVTSSALVAGPYFWAILFYVWLSIAVALTLGARLLRDLAAARDRAEAANVAKSRFLATMSHEIRTPMNGILGMAQLLQQPQMADPERHDAARTILQSGKTLLTLLNDILDLSKVEAGKFDLSPAPFEPDQLVAEIGTLFAEGARAKGLVLDWQWHGPARTYRGDATRLRQMLSNLVGNAIKFTQQGRVHIAAREVAHAGSSTTLEFSVTDTGIGLSGQQRALVFQPFSQADSSITREYGGTGLGLSIVRHLARLMDGDADVDSTPGTGSRFWFRVVVEEAPSPASSATSTAPDLAAPEAPGMPSPPPASTPGASAASLPVGARVLVVEDNAINQAVVAAMLRKLGLVPVLAADGALGVAALQGGEPAALVLMDVQMPVLDGYAATGRIRAWEAAGGRARLPIVALTADAYEEDRQRCLAAGMDDFLAKPVDYRQLQAVLAKWLAAYSMGTAAAPTIQK